MLIFSSFLDSCSNNVTISPEQLQTAVAAVLKETAFSYTQTLDFTSTPEVTETPTPTSIPTNSSSDYGRLNNPVRLSDNWGFCQDDTCCQMELLEIIRGDEANYLIHQASSLFNPLPPDNMSWIFIKLKITLTKGGPITINYFDFSLLSNGQLFGLADSASDSACCTESIGYDDLWFTLGTPGSSGEGWIITYVFLDDFEPLLIYGLKSNNPNLDTALYFSLYE